MVSVWFGLLCRFCLAGLVVLRAGGVSGLGRCLVWVFSLLAV